MKQKRRVLASWRLMDLELVEPPKASIFIGFFVTESIEAEQEKPGVGCGFDIEGIGRSFNRDSVAGL